MVTYNFIDHREKNRDSFPSQRTKREVSYVDSLKHTKR